MMRLLCLLPFAFVAVSGFCGTANITYTWTDFQLGAQSVRKATQTPLQSLADYNGAILSAIPSSIVTGTNGSATFSNTVAGYAYQIQLDTPFGSTVRTCAIPSSVTGNINGRDYLGDFNGQSFYYLYLAVQPNDSRALLFTNARNVFAGAVASGGILTNVTIYQGLNFGGIQGLTSAGRIAGLASGQLAWLDGITYDKSAGGLNVGNVTATGAIAANSGSTCGVVTNGTAVWLSTNAAPSGAWPTGSICTRTDTGQLYIFFSGGWALK